MLDLKEQIEVRIQIWYKLFKEHATKSSAKGVIVFDVTDEI